MNLSSVKNLYLRIPPSFLSPLEFVPYKVFAGASYRTQSKILSYFDNLEVDEQKNFAEKMGVNFLNDAIKYVPFYREWARDNKIKTVKTLRDLHLFPVIDKTTVMGRLQDFCDERSSGRYMVSTGGTTGRPMKFYHTGKCYGREWAFLANFLQKHGLSVDARRYSLRGVDTLMSDTGIGKNPLYKELKIAPRSLTKNSLIANWMEIQKYKGQWIHGYPSLVYQFCLLVEKLNLSLPTVKGVLLISEKLHEFQKEKISEVLNCSVLSFYGTSERVVFAPLDDEELVPHPLYGVSEVVNGEHVGTGYINDGTVLIRYRTGDAVRPKTTVNNLVTSIGQFEGRWLTDSLVGLGGETINMTVLNTHDPIITLLKNFQFVQKSVGKVSLRVVPEDHLSDENIAKILNLFGKKLGPNYQLDLEVTDEILSTSRGKHRYIVSDIEQ